MKLLFFISCHCISYLLCVLVRTSTCAMETSVSHEHIKQLLCMWTQEGGISSLCCVCMCSCVLVGGVCGGKTLWWPVPPAKVRGSWGWLGPERRWMGVNGRTWLLGPKGDYCTLTYSLYTLKLLLLLLCVCVQASNMHESRTGGPVTKGSAVFFFLKSVRGNPLSAF